MRTLVITLLAGCCMAGPLLRTPVSFDGQQWTAFSFSQDSAPAVVRIAAPNIKFAIPQYPTVASAVPVPAPQPLPVIKSVAPIFAAPAPVTAVHAAPAPVPVVEAVPAPVPVIKAVPAQVPVVQAVPAPIPVVKAVSAPVVAAAPTPVVVAAAPEPLQAPEPPMPSIGTPFIGGQFRSQAETGEYTFGHWGGPNTRVENRDSLGRTTGSFAYVDPEGEVQVRKYAASPASGFKVAASDLPVNNNIVVQDTPEVAQVKAVHAQAYAAIKTLVAPNTIVA
ncbi:hypothetical protein SK128_008558 [Halocaridina rubra]|uniref:Cuticle protein n=1 Tax=Halocaridina rubra TaxID=373956 RepID=A0AAN8XSM4_HALRR